MAYWRNNPNTQPLSTTDPCFKSFPADPKENPQLRGARIDNPRAKTPEIHLDETPEEHEGFENLRKRFAKRQDWKRRKNVALDRLWHSKYSGRASQDPYRGLFVPGSYEDGESDEMEFEDYLATIRRDYEQSTRKQKKEASERKNRKADNLTDYADDAGEAEGRGSLKDEEEMEPEIAGVGPSRHEFADTPHEKEKKDSKR
ncbi:hypothetical protein ABW20_dc0102894 [Dactylellina cionopaga]|nr:hypothetical protein ABW20_dc0102894 [Dactylellina cionopaga]